MIHMLHTYRTQGSAKAGFRPRCGPEKALTQQNRGPARPRCKKVPQRLGQAQAKKVARVKILAQTKILAQP